MKRLLKKAEQESYFDWYMNPKNELDVTLDGESVTEGDVDDLLFEEDEGDMKSYYDEDSDDEFDDEELPKYQSHHRASFVNRLMKKGKR